uniref:Uncharacterized protein n=1 Tax=Acrobeloides nanus TaxID=290746 RepID=A0A914C1K8_9BILA
MPNVFGEKSIFNEYGLKPVLEKEDCDSEYSNCFDNPSWNRIWQDSYGSSKGDRKSFVRSLVKSTRNYFTTAGARAILYEEKEITAALEYTERIQEDSGITNFSRINGCCVKNTVFNGIFVDVRIEYIQGQPIEKCIKYPEPYFYPDCGTTHGQNPELFKGITECTAKSQSNKYRYLEMASCLNKEISKTREALFAYSTFYGPSTMSEDCWQKAISIEGTMTPNEWKGINKSQYAFPKCISRLFLGCYENIQTVYFNYIFM